MIELTNPAHFNLQTIMNSGQCFRIFEPMPDVYDVLAAGKWVRVYHDAATKTYTFDCSSQEFFEWWIEYFDLKNNYESYFDSVIMTSNAIEKKIDNMHCTFDYVDRMWKGRCYERYK